MVSQQPESSVAELQKREGSILSDLIGRQGFIRGDACRGKIKATGRILVV